jgi:hypothetical protein
MTATTAETDPVIFGMGGSHFLLTQHLQFVLGYGPLDAGLRTAPLALTVIAEFGNGLGVAVLGAVLNSRFAALVPAVMGAASLPAALAAAGGAGERERISDAFASGLQTSQLVGAVAVLAGGLLAAMLLRRVDRAESPSAAE